MIYFHIYTLAFIFNEDLSKILLIEKTKPEWQAGSLNGIGGKLEVSDPSTHACIKREVFEECGLDINENEFHSIGNIKSDSYVVVIYTTKLNNELFNSAFSKTEEKIKIIETKSIFNEKLLPSVLYLIPMAMQYFIDKNFNNFQINYK